MASLSQTLRQQRQGQVKRGPGGQLSQETPEEIQSLAGQAGLQAPPTTPVGAAALGANKDQQKMMGTPAQKQAALSLASQPVEQGLSGALRRAQSRTEMTAEETQQKEKSQDMMNLGSLGQRVTDFIDAQRQALTAQAQQATAQQTLQVEASTSFEGKDVSAIKSLLDQYRREPNNQQLLLQINQALGYDVNTQLDPAKVQELYESATDTIARGAAGNVDNDLTVSDLVSQGNLGYTPEQLQDLLGVPANQLQTMTVGQLRAEIERVGLEEFNQTAELQQKAESGILGQAERQLARQAGREMSATGVRATEADYQSMEQQIQNADRVTFGGREYQVDELLQDETISNIIKDYMESGPDSDIRKQVDAAEPALKEFIQKNQAVLQEASSSMEAGAQEFRDIQAANKQLQTIEGLQLDNTLAAKLIPGFGTLQAQRIDPNSVPFFQALNAMPSSNRRRQAVDALNAAQDQYPDVADQLSGLSAQQVSQLNIGKPEGFFNKWLSAKQQQDRIAAIPATDINSLVSEAFEDTGPEAFREKQKDARLIGSTFGLDTGLSMDISTTDSLKQDMLNSIVAGNLAEAADGNISIYQKKKLGQVQYPKDPIQSNWILQAKPYGLDGSLDADEVKALVESPMVSKERPSEAVRTLRILEDMANNPKANIDKEAVRQARQAATDNNTQEQLNFNGTPGNPNSQLDNYLNMFNQARQDPRTLNPDRVRAGVVNTVMHELKTRGSKAMDRNSLELARKAMQTGDQATIDAIRNSPELQQSIAQYAAWNASANTPKVQTSGKQKSSQQDIDSARMQYAAHYNEALKHWADIFDTNTMRQTYTPTKGK